jgi:L,D-transpeptidase YbiS
MRGITRLATCGAAAFLAAAPCVRAQHQFASRTNRVAHILAGRAYANVTTLRFHKFSSRADSLEYERARRVADRAGGFRIVISLEDHHLWVLAGADTLRSASAAIARGTTLDYEGREWKFVMPRGVRTVLAKDADPVWQPPEWEYAEAASAYGLKIGHLDAEHTVTLHDGSLLSVENGEVGLVKNGVFAALPTDEHIVFDSTLFVPPLGSKNRMVHGELGHYALKLGDGYMIHGTPDQQSIGLAATHGCVRLSDDDIAWIYRAVSVGVKVYVY